MFSFFFFTVFYYTKTSKEKNYFFLILILTYFFVPHNLHVSLSIFFADTIVSVLLPCVFLLLLIKNNSKYYLLSFFLFVLYLSKTSMFFLTIGIPLVILYLEKDHIKYKILPVVAVIVAIFSWGLFGLSKTGQFPFAGKLLSVAAEGMTYALNDKFHKYYPNKSVDLIPPPIKLPKNIKNEWEAFEFYQKYNKEYIRENLDRYIKDFFIKLKFVFFNIKKESSFPDEDGLYKNPIRISYIINKFFFNISLFFSIFIVLKNFRKFRHNKIEIYFLALVALNILPLLVGWVTAKHLTGVSSISILYFLIKSKKILNF